MFLALLITTLYGFFVWLVFFKMKWIKFNIGWGLVSGSVGLHVLLIFVIGLRFVAPYSTDAKVIQQTIQLIPRLPEPTLVTGVLVKSNVPVKKGQPLFQFDRRPYEYKVNAVNAQLAAAEQHVLELKAQWNAASGAVAQAKAQRAALKAQLDAAVATVSEARAKRVTLKASLDAAIAAVANAKANRDLAGSTFQIAETLKKSSAGEAISKLKVDEARDGLAATEAAFQGAQANEQKARAAYGAEAEAAIQVALANEEQARVAFQETAEAAIQIAQANEEKARLAFESDINGENTTVAQLKADLALAEYYLENTTLRAPDDGRIVNLQVQEGMVAGIIRIGGIASFIVDADRYLLATYNQEVLKWIQSGQPVEVALDLYPGQIFKGKVQGVWRASGEGQLLPSGELPKFNPPPPAIPQGRFAVQIVLQEADQSMFPIGAQGAAAIYTEGGGFAAMRRIGIRGRTWANWLYPLPI